MSLPLRRKENHKLSKIELISYDLEFLAVFEHFISYIQQFNIGPILFWFFSGPHVARGPHVGKLCRKGYMGYKQIYILTNAEMVGNNTFKAKY